MASNQPPIAADPGVRASGLGGSDAAAAAGCNPYKTQYQLYLEKVGELPPPDLSDNDAVHFGTVLEDVIAQEFTRRTKLKVRRNNRTLRHPKFDYMMAHVDREVVGEDAILECKTAGAHMVHEWGQQYTAEVPEHYLFQVLHYLIVTGKATAYLAVLIGGRDFRIYEINRADFAEECEKLPQLLGAFWQRVQERRPPDPTNVGDLALLYPNHRIPAVEATTGLVEVVENLASIKERIKELKGRQEELEFTVKKHMGQAAELQAGGRVIASWKGALARRLDQKALKKAHPQLVKEFTVEAQQRRFAIKIKGEV